MADDRGKEFEGITKVSLLAEGCCVDRLPDQMTGNAGSTNPGDFIAYLKPYLFYIECKSCIPTSFDIKSHISEGQWVRILKKAQARYPGVYVGYLVWLVTDEKMFWIPALKMAELYKEQKSFTSESVASWAVSVPYQIKRKKPIIQNLTKIIVNGERKLKK